MFKQKSSVRLSSVFYIDLSSFLFLFILYFIFIHSMLAVNTFSKVLKESKNIYNNLEISKQIFMNSGTKEKNKAQKCGILKEIHFFLL